MKTASVRFGVLVGIAALCVLSGGLSVADAPAGAGKWLLYPAQDEASVERKIAEYMKDRGNIDATIKYLDKEKKDLYLQYTLDPEGTPKINVGVDTMVTARDEGKVAKRAVRAAAFYVLPASAKTPEARRKILELNNTWHQQKWMPGRIYLDKDGDVALETYINIPGTATPIPAAMVADMLLRTNTMWGVYYKQLAGVVNLKKPKPTADE